MNNAQSGEGMGIPPSTTDSVSPAGSSMADSTAGSTAGAPSHVSGRASSHGWRSHLLVRLFSSIWLAVFLLSLLFVYSSIGSAIPRFRQLPVFEMTEYEWFNWWPFDLLIALICLNMLVASIRRIPFRLVNLGVWSIHAGILTLALGSVYYFGTKVEGDAPVFRRWVRITVPGADRPAALLSIPSARTSLATPRGVYQFGVESTNSDYSLLSGEDQGKKTYAVTVQIQTPDGQSFARQLLAGYPQYTDDVVPGQGRAINLLERPLVDDRIRMTLELEPQAYFHVRDSWALYVRPVGTKEWTQCGLDGLPRYNRYISSRDDVLTDEPIQRRLLDVPVQVPESASFLSNVSLHVTGYLPYAQLRSEWAGGGDHFYPVLTADLVSGDGRASAMTMAAFDTTRSGGADGLVEFRYVPDESAIVDLPSNTTGRLHVNVPDVNVSMSVPITAETRKGRDGPWIPVEGTSFSYRMVATSEDFHRPAGQESPSMAWLELKTGDESWTRLVFEGDSGVLDVPGTGLSTSNIMERLPQPPDPRIVTRYEPPSAQVIFAVLPDGRLFAVGNGPEAYRFRKFVELGESLPIGPFASVKPRALLLRGRRIFKPYVVPRTRQQPSARQANYFSMIKLDVASAGGTQSEWIEYSMYVFPNAQYDYPGRHRYQPVTMTLKDGRQIEVIFSRRRQRLPAPVALRDFRLLAHLGGYQGSGMTIRNWVSEVTFWDGSGWSPSQQLSVNSPTEYDGFWFYQAAWDRPPDRAPSAGMNFSVLGVGNRNGVYIQLLGCCISVMGMIFAFYVKPRLIQRRRLRALAKSGLLAENADVQPNASQLPPVPAGVG